MKTIFSILFLCLTSQIDGQTFGIEPEFRIERTNGGNINFYSGITLVKQIEKNQSGGYNVYLYSSKWLGRDLVESVEKGIGDEYIVYSYANGYKQKSHSITGYDSYLKQLYPSPDESRSSVKVYDVTRSNNSNTSKEYDSSPVKVYGVNPSNGYIDNLGKTVLPADIKPIDFSEVDRLIAAEERETAELQKLYMRALEIASILTKGGISETERTSLLKELKVIGEKGEKLAKY